MPDGSLSFTPAAPRGVAPPEVWEAVRADYLAGLSAPECCRRHGVGLTALRVRAARDGWRRADQPWVAPDPADALALDPLDEGAALEAKVEGDLDHVELTDLSWVAHRRMMRAVLRGDAQAALRWRRVRLAMDAEFDELTRDVEEMERFHALHLRRGDGEGEAHDPNGPNGLNGVFPDGA